MYSENNATYFTDFIHHKQKDQYTGLEDKNGKEIYEGDIFNYRSYSNGIVYVEYHEDMFHLKSIKYPNLSPGNFRLASLNEQLEIIGNIYENKELLK